MLGADRAEDISRGGSLVCRRAWTRAPLGPTAGDLVLLADAGLVGEPDLYGGGLDALLAPDLLQARGKAYGMARPSFRRRRVAGGSEGGDGYGFGGISVLGVDLGKNVCSVVGLDASGAVVMRRKMRRETLIALAGETSSMRCRDGGLLRGSSSRPGVRGSRPHVRLMSPEYVRPYIKAQKNDDRDAEGIAEAATRPTMRFVELKSQDQLDIQTLHRSRDRLVGERTALINQLRAILLERGMSRPRASGSSSSS